MKEVLFLQCSLCEYKVYLETSKVLGAKFKGHAEVNVRCVQAGMSTGNGRNNLEKICTTLNLPPPVTSNFYNSILKSVSENSIVEANESMQKAAINLKDYVISSDAEYNDMNRESDIFCVSVSIDGTWQKRYGFNSLLGAVFIISIETGEVLDYEVKCKYCFECKSRGKWDKQSARYISSSWYESHREDCSINHF